MAVSTAVPTAVTVTAPCGVPAATAPVVSYCLAKVRCSGTGRYDGGSAAAATTVVADAADGLVKGTGRLDAANDV